MTRQAFSTSSSPEPVGPYSQVVRLGNLVAASGQAGIDPSTGVVAASDIAGQTLQTFANLAHALNAAGLSFDDALHVRVYLADLSDFDAMNTVYEQHFAEPFPARTTIGASLPNGLLVEIDILAVRDT